MGGWVGGWMDGWMDGGWMGGWVGGWMETEGEIGKQRHSEREMEKTGKELRGKGRLQRSREDKTCD
jgi:hypothetical protein